MVPESTICLTDRCCRFMENFPVRLRELRISFSKIRDFYEANDDLETALLDDNIEHYFTTQFGCHAMDNVLQFYLETVLPKAVGETDNDDFKRPIDSIGSIFNELKTDIVKCRNYFSCKAPFDVRELVSSYNKMSDKGLYKAMGELDLFFNYIEKYLASKKRKNSRI
ncbi:interleukin-10 [Aplochiton taeniatus]